MPPPGGFCANVKERRITFRNKKAARALLRAARLTTAGFPRFCRYHQQLAVREGSAARENRRESPKSPQILAGVYHTFGGLGNNREFRLLVIGTVSGEPPKRPSPLTKRQSGMNVEVCPPVGLVTCPNCQVAMPRISLTPPENEKPLRKAIYRCPRCGAETGRWIVLWGRKENSPAWPAGFF
jgi:hypothetical protein